MSLQIKNRKLTDEQIKAIPSKINDHGMTEGKIAEEYGVHVRTIGYWIKKLREAAKDQNVELLINTRAGRRATTLNIKDI